MIFSNVFHIKFNNFLFNLFMLTTFSTLVYEIRNFSFIFILLFFVILLLIL